VAPWVVARGLDPITQKRQHSGTAWRTSFDPAFSYAFPSCLSGFAQPPEWSVYLRRQDELLYFLPLAIRRGWIVGLTSIGPVFVYVYFRLPSVFHMHALMHCASSDGYNRAQAACWLRGEAR
jgi:hypothetical protein